MSIEHISPQQPRKALNVIPTDIPPPKPEDGLTSLETIEEALWTEQDEKDLCDTIQNTPNNLIRNFYEIQLRFHEHLNDLSQEAVDFILQDAFGRFQTLASEQDQHFPSKEQNGLFSSLTYALMKMNPYGNDDNHKEPRSVITSTWKVFTKLAPSYPEASYVFQKYIFDYMFGHIDPDSAVDGAVELFWKPEVSKKIKSEIVESMQLEYLTKKEKFSSIIIKNLDFENPKNFFHTGVYLDYVKRLHESTRTSKYLWAFSKDFIQLLEGVVRDKKGSYFLFLQAKELLETMKEREQDNEFGQAEQQSESSSDSFMIAPGIMGKYDVNAYELSVGKNPSSLEPINQSNISFGENEVIDPESNAQLVRNYSYLSRPETRKLIEMELGFSLSQISIPEQVQFLEWAKEQPATEIERTRTFIQKHGVNGVRTFFSMDNGRQRAILTMGEHLQPEVARAVFQKHAELLDAAAQVTDFIRTGFNQEAVQKVVAAVESKIFDRAFNLLADFHAVAFTDSFNFSERNLRDQSVIEKYVRDIDSIKTDIELFKNTFKTLSEEGVEFSLEDIAGADLRKIRGGELGIDDVAIMRAMYSENQKEAGAHDTLLDHFDERVRNPEAKFHIFKWQGNIQSFVAFEPGKKYPGAFEMTSFNVNPEARGYKIGEAMLESVIEEEARENELEAECYAGLSIASKYIETGWVAEGFFTEPGKEEGTIDKILAIHRNDEHRHIYWGSLSISQEQIMQQIDIPSFVQVVSVETQNDLPFEKLNEGYVITRLFRDPLSQKHFAVFEPFKNVPKSEVN